ncbi:Ribonuclease/ribotoxin [Aspergillus minisclerotigenes]|uniref:ribonuclease T1 n=1 Tax=Aspergillus minisclerotigenes TaxID=656917 RepID=A0A5N6JB76_9EURO|nr:Ribonuclease/ribotoxin [Aspergillus minisclerotigenes]
MSALLAAVGIQSLFASPVENTIKLATFLYLKDFAGKMKFLFLFAILVSACLAMHLPAGQQPLQSNDDFETLVEGTIPAGVACGPRQYNGTDIEKAANQALQLHNDPADHAYPHKFLNVDNFVFSGCSGSDLQEFPLLRTVPWNGGRAGADRVIVVWDASGGVRYCGVIQHIRGDNLGACNVKSR